MGYPDIKFVGNACGQHGPYTFYKAFKYKRRDQWKMLSLGEFFFVKISKDAPCCIGELQLLWNDKNNAEYTLAMLKLYFLPENTPDGRQDSHGQDELLCASDRVPLHISDLLGWLTEAQDATWDAGTVALKQVPHESSKPRNVELHGKFDATNCGLYMADVEKERSSFGPEGSSGCSVAVLSYPHYCRVRALLRRLEGCGGRSSSATDPSSSSTDPSSSSTVDPSSSTEPGSWWLHDLAVTALCGMSRISSSTRIMFCRDTFDSIDVQDHELRQDDLTPNLKGRRRKKKLVLKKEQLNSQDTDSSESSEYFVDKKMVLNGNVKMERTEAEDENENVKQRIKQEMSSGAKAELNSQKSPFKDRQNGHSFTMLKPCGSRETVCLDDICESPEKFLPRLYAFNKEKGNPIIRVPTLGFKEVDLHHFYFYAKRLGGYEQITAKRLWKHMYDALGGNPSNTSAATCTRRHYEKILLEFELHERGQTSKGIPPPYMRPPKKPSMPALKDGLSERQRQALEEEAKWESRKRLQPGAKAHKSSILEQERQWAERRRASSWIGKDKVNRSHPYRPVGCHSASASPVPVPPHRSSSSSSGGISIMSPARTVPVPSPQQHRQQVPQHAPPPPSTHHHRSPRRHHLPAPAVQIPPPPAGSAKTPPPAPAHKHQRGKIPENPLPYHVQERPSVIQHTKNSSGSGSKKPLILNPAPVRHTGLPRYVYGPMNIDGLKRTFCGDRALKREQGPPRAHVRSQEEEAKLKQFILGSQLAQPQPPPPPPPPKDDFACDFSAKRPRLQAYHPSPEKANPHRAMNLTAKSSGLPPPPLHPLVPTPRLPSPHHHRAGGRRSESPRRNTSQAQTAAAAVALPTASTEAQLAAAAALVHPAFPLHPGFLMPQGLFTPSMSLPAVPFPPPQLLYPTAKSQHLSPSSSSQNSPSMSSAASMLPPVPSSSSSAPGVSAALPPPPGFIYDQASQYMLQLYPQMYGAGGGGPVPPTTTSNT